MVRMPQPLCQLPADFRLRVRRVGVRLTPDALLVSIMNQKMLWVSALHHEITRCQPASHTACRWATRDSSSTYVTVLKTFTVSTSRFGIGQQAGSNRTPLGLHRVAFKVGDGYPIGTVFQARRPVGLTHKGQPAAPIAHRVLWLEGLEPGFNRGGSVDSFQRYIYIHGVGDESGMGRPASRGCIHMAANDLLMMFDRLPVHTLVWISEDPAPTFCIPVRSTNV
jgi:hypothetical protein